MRNPYEVLNVPPDATLDVIRSAWRKLCRLHHPDRGGSPAMQAEINVAYNLLSDQAARERYDLSGNADERPPIEVGAATILMQIVNVMMLAENEWHSLRLALDENIDNNLVNNIKRRTSLERKLKRIDEQSKKLKLTVRGKNVVGGVFDQLHETLTNQFTETDRIVKVLERSKEMIGELFDKDEMLPDAMQKFQQFASFTSFHNP